MWVMVFSCVMVLFVESMVPFGVSASWSSDSLGSSLVFTHPVATAKIGQKVAKSTEIQGEVSVFTVEEVLRREGLSYYRVSSSASTELVTIPVVELGRAVLMQVPLLGFFAQSLKNTLGVMTLVGLPLLMLLINFIVFSTRRVLFALSVFENSPKSRRVRRVQKKIVEESETPSYRPEESKREIEREFVTVLKPYNFQQKYSH
jgi:hypothetical protein